MRAIAQPRQSLQVFLLDSLKGFFGEFDDATFQRMLPMLEWFELDAGECLFKEGEDGSDMFFVVSGRLSVSKQDRLGHVHSLGDVVRGESLGELALLCGKPRTATVAAIRDSILARLPARAFHRLLDDIPQLSRHLLKQTVHRLTRSSPDAEIRTHPQNVTLLPVTPEIDARHLARDLAKRLGDSVLVLTGEMIRSRFGTGSYGRRRNDDLTLTRWLDEQEHRYEWLLWVASPTDADWTRHCLAYADEILLLAPAGDPSPPGAVEAELYAGRHGRERALRRLILLHDETDAPPRHTARWLQSRTVDSHLHLRSGRVADLDRLARTVARRTTGLVLSGGGARGFAHLGVYRALHEAGIPLDLVGGTSMGAVVGSLIALEIPPRDAIESFRDVFSQRPLGDYSAVPVISLIAGNRLERLLDRAYHQLGCGARGLEDCWKPLFCVASSYSHAREMLLHDGPMLKMLRASLSLPGLFPPVYHDGEVLVDGGIFNNFPTDHMRKQGTATVIGVDLGRETFGPVSGERAPGALRLLRLWVGRRSERVPTLRDMLFRAPLLYSKSRQERMALGADWLLRPELGDIGLLDWKSLERAIEIGYRHACMRLEAADFADRA